VIEHWSELARDYVYPGGSSNLPTRNSTLVVAINSRCGIIPA